MEPGTPEGVGHRIEGHQEESHGNKAFIPATGIPGFGDPVGAEPGFWVADPGGAIRVRWFLDLKTLLGLPPEEPHDPA